MDTPVVRYIYIHTIPGARSMTTSEVVIEIIMMS